MSLPKQWESVLWPPVLAAPMFLVSCPDLVVEACRAGMLGAFPSLNQRDVSGYRDWLAEIVERLAQAAGADGRLPAPFAVNISVRRGNPRMEADLAATVDQRVPVVITSLGAAREVVEAVHAYGGLVLHDVTSLRHAEKAVAAGVDGVIAVAAGAGGHGGNLSPFAFLTELRAMFDGVIVLGGAITSGRQIVAARLMGADMVSMGTRFIATAESAATAEQKAMVLRASAADIVYTPRMTGVPANFMAESLRLYGLDPLALDGAAIEPSTRTVRHAGGEARVWRDIWSAGQGVGAVADLPTVAELGLRLRREMDEAVHDLAGLAAPPAHPAA